MKTELQGLASDISQTFFVGRATNGWILLAILILFLPVPTVYGLCCAWIARQYSHRLQSNKLLKESGIFGLNGFFFGLSISSLYALSVTQVGIALVGSICLSIATVFLHRLLWQWRFPLLVLPYCVMLWLVQASQGLLKLEMTVHTPPLIEGPLNLPLSTLCNSLSQIFYSSSFSLGATLWLFLFFTHPRLFGSALAGVILTNLGAYLLGANLVEVGLGHWGFCGALSGIALGLAYERVPATQVVVGIFLTLLFSAAIQGIARQVGLSACAFPYILGVWATVHTLPVQPGLNTIPVSNWWGRPLSSPSASVGFETFRNFLPG